MLRKYNVHDVLVSVAYRSVSQNAVLEAIPLFSFVRENTVGALDYCSRDQHERVRSRHASRISSHLNHSIGQKDTLPFEILSPTASLPSSVLVKTTFCDPFDLG